MKKKRGLVSCIQEFKKDTILTPIFVIGEVAFDVLIPMMTGRLTQGVEAGNMERIFYYGGIVVLMALAALLLGARSGRYAARAATGFSRNLRREMYRNVQKFSFSNIDKFSTGGIITRLTTDVTNVQMAFMMIIRIAVRCPIMLICAWVLTFTINPRLALCVRSTRRKNSGKSPRRSIWTFPRRKSSSPSTCRSCSCASMHVF